MQPQRKERFHRLIKQEASDEVPQPKRKRFTTLGIENSKEVPLLDNKIQNHSIDKKRTKSSTIKKGRKKHLEIYKRFKHEQTNSLQNLRSEIGHNIQSSEYKSLSIEEIKNLKKLEDSSNFNENSFKPENMQEELPTIDIIEEYEPTDHMYGTISSIIYGHIKSMGFQMHLVVEDYIKFNKIKKSVKVFTNLLNPLEKELTHQEYIDDALKAEIELKENVKQRGLKFVKHFEEVFLAFNKDKRSLILIFLEVVRCVMRITNKGTQIPQHRKLDIYKNLMYGMLQKNRKKQFRFFFLQMKENHFLALLKTAFINCLSKNVGSPASSLCSRSSEQSFVEPSSACRLIVSIPLEKIHIQLPTCGKISYKEIDAKETLASTTTILEEAASKSTSR